MAGLLYSADVHFQGIKSGSGGDEQGFSVFAAEGDIGGPSLLGDGDIGDFSAFRIENRYAIAGQIDVAAGVDSHAVGAEVAERPLACQAAIGLDVVFPGLAGLDIGDKKRFAIRGADDAVGLLEVAFDTDQLAVGREKIDALAGLFHRAALPVGAFVEWIGEIDAAVGANPGVIGAIEQFAIVVFG